MGFATAIRTCLTKYFALAGRAARPEYWWFALFCALICLAASLFDGMIFGFDAENTPGQHPITMIASFVTFFPLLAAGWRRMHDTGRPGWVALLPECMVLLGFVAFLISVGLAGLIGHVTDAPSDTMRDVDRVIGQSTVILFYAAAIGAALLKLWWLTRPGDEGANEYGPAPTH
ncbi:MAG: DUF805 domain-containing protein [Mangrovicoccus sp.]|nr:DUF805 domain-containing protein [Mangrovicoccus sp.]